MNAGKSPSPLLAILGKQELVSEIEEVIELCLGVMVEEQKITQTKYDEVAKFFQDRMGLHLNPSSVSTTSSPSPVEPKQEKVPEHTPSVKKEASTLRHKIKHTKSKASVQHQPELTEELEEEVTAVNESTEEEHITEAKSEGKYPAKGGGKEWKAPDYFEFKGVKWTTPDWAKKKQKNFNTFKHNVIHGKWRGAEWPNANKKDEPKVFNKDTSPHNLPTKDQRKAVRNAARAGTIGNERTLPTGPKVQEMLNTGKKDDKPNLAHQHGYVNHKVIEDNEMVAGPSSDVEEDEFAA